MRWNYYYSRVLLTSSCDCGWNSSAAFGWLGRFVRTRVWSPLQCWVAMLPSGVTAVPPGGFPVGRGMFCVVEIVFRFIGT